MYRKIFIDKYLTQGIDFDEAKSEVDFALDVLFRYTYKDFMLGKVLENWQVAKLHKVFDERVSTHRPIQQIVGQAFFYGRKYFVNEDTLIPRPETELLVSEVLNVAKMIESPKVLDIGSGTGCIPISLVLENPAIIAHSVDISRGAIEMAEKNALLHNIYDKVKLHLHIHQPDQWKLQKDDRRHVRSCRILLGEILSVTPLSKRGKRFEICNNLVWRPISE